MCEKATLLKVVRASKDELVHAVAALENEPRPANVCAAHDRLFAVQRATSSGVVALLSSEESKLEGSVALQPGVTPYGALRHAVAQNIRLVIVAGTVFLTVTVTVALLTRQMGEYTEALKTVHGAVTNGR